MVKNHYRAMMFEAGNGNIQAVKEYKDQGATDFNRAMILASLYGHMQIIKLLKEFGATDFN